MTLITTQVTENYSVEAIRYIMPLHVAMKTSRHWYSLTTHSNSLTTSVSYSHTWGHYCGSVQLALCSVHIWDKTR